MISRDVRTWAEGANRDEASTSGSRRNGVNTVYFLDTTGKACPDGVGQPYTVRGYPAGDNTATGLPWAPATDGLRNITGQLDRNGTVTIWAITSTVSGSGDQGADPSKLVQITDPRGVSFTPGTRDR